MIETNLPLCSYCGNSQFNHELQDHNFMPVGGGNGALYHVPLDRKWHPVKPPPKPFTPREKFLLLVGLALIAWTAGIIIYRRIFG